MIVFDCARTLRGSDPPSSETVTVTGWTPGANGCLPPIDASAGDAGSESDHHRLRVQLADGSERSFDVGVPGLNPRLTVGTKVTMNITPYYGVLGQAQIGSFELRDETGLLLYVGDGRRPETLNPPVNVSIALGAAVCPIDDPCGALSRFRLLVMVDGASAEIAPGDSARLGRYEVVADSRQVLSSTVSHCSDWEGSWVNVGIALL